MAVVRKPISMPANSRWVNRENAHLLSSIGRYTKFVLFSKMFLGLMSAGLIAVIIILPVLNSDKEGLRIAFSTVKGKDDALPMMTNPRFQGVDDDNQPYTITADSALQHDEHTIILDNIHADVFMQDQSWISLQAPEGTLNRTEKDLQLSGGVQLFHDEGYEFVAETVHVDMNSQIATSDTVVAGQGPVGDLKAEGFTWHNTDRVIFFDGRVFLTIAMDDE